jgi:N-glycosylase/DNA lyase
MKSAVAVNEVVAYVLERCRNNDDLEPKFAIIRDPEKVWQNLIFCILSSQVPANKARHAAQQVASRVQLFHDYLPIGKLHYYIESVLASPEVRYRFPRSKAAQIADSWFAFAQVKDVFHNYLASFNDERSARNDVAAKFPGLGLKQASMLMRDIGFSKNLAVIDTHILWFASKTLGFDADAQTEKRYLKLENELIEQAGRFCVELNTFDVAIWSSVRAVKAYYV